jgi:hypothetical protein
MIGCRQVPYKTPIGGAGAESPIMAIFQQLWQPLFAGSWMSPWVTYDAGKLTKCWGFCNVGTFTAKVYINGVHSFTVTESDTSTPVDLIAGDGTLLVPDIITCEITSCSSNVEGVHIQAS